MNTILGTLKRPDGWLAEAMTPGGERLVTHSEKSEADAIEKARRAQPEPA